VKEDPKLEMMRWHADMAHLREMIQQTGWDTYQRYVDKVIGEHTERVLSGTDMDYERGVVAGLRRALSLPSEVIVNTQAARDN
jgi:hypothetical protein